MVFRLDLKDKKILTLLDENARLSNSQIAKKVKLSKPTIEYRLKRLEKNKVIFSYYTIIDITKMGLSQYKVYFKFQNVTLEDEKKLVRYWVKNKNSVWVGQIRGRWDLSVSLFARSNFEFGKILNDFMNLYSRFILEKDVLLTEYSPIYAREYLVETKESQFIYGSPKRFYKLDREEVKILRVLAKNSRISIVQLVKESGLTRDTINYRLKKLVRDGIIVQYRCYLNLNKIGINLYKVILGTKNFDEQSEKLVKDYVGRNKKATQFLKLIGSWDLEIEFETENEDELYGMLTEVRKRFSGIIRDFDIMRITETYKYNYFPF